MTTDETQYDVPGDTDGSDNGGKQRRAKGSAPASERLARAQATLKGLAADVLASDNADVLPAYRAVLAGVETLTAAFGATD